MRDYAEASPVAPRFPSEGGPRSPIGADEFCIITAADEYFSLPSAGSGEEKSDARYVGGGSSQGRRSAGALRAEVRR
jgi:hypothetical protein